MEKSVIHGISIPINLELVKQILNLDLRIALFLKRDGKDTPEIMEYHFIKKKGPVTKLLCVQYKSIVDDILRLGGTSKCMSEIEEYFAPHFTTENVKYIVTNIEVFPRDWNDYCDSDMERINILQGYINALGVSDIKASNIPVPMEEDSSSPKIDKKGDEDKKKMEEIAQFLAKLKLIDEDKH
ncbi:MAG TPA: hypothetical protein PKD85_00760 [Saprospiraceae bacterium]|nr:hypothetical protein [Saprospiraceae bacterium]